MQTASNSLQRITKSRSPRNPNRKMEHETIRYKERLRALKTLPLSMYIELHGTLFLHSVMDGKYNVEDESIPVSMRNSATRQSSDFELRENCLHKTDERFGTRAPKLFNVQPDKEKTDRTLLQKQLQSIDTCTWRVLCSCGSCNPYKKTRTSGKLRGSHPWAMSLKASATTNSTLGEREKKISKT